jgi:glycosyltransferase 2 family protein
VLASILVEAGLSAISGVIVFVVSLAWVRGVDAPLPLLVGFAVLLAVLLHPRIFRPVAERILRPFNARIEPLPFGLTILLLLFYCATWLIGGFALYFLLRSVGADPGLRVVPFLGGTAAVGAIVAVLAVFSPSGLGVREASMYGLLLAVTDEGPALSAALMNRLTITVVELALFGAGLVGWRRR